MRSVNYWVRCPIGLGSENWITRTGCRMVLAMVPTVTAGTRLLDLVPLLNGDHRIQVVFTVPGSDETWHGVEDFVRGCGGLVLSWQQALRQRWDLVLSASHRHIESIHGAILILPHGAGSLRSLRRSRKAGSPTRDTTGLDRELLTYRGRLIPATIALTTQGELDTLRRTCPEAVPVATVAGDLCLDRMIISEPLRRYYRHALGVRDGEELITISSTWSPVATFGRHPHLYTRLLEEIETRPIRVAAVLHPNVWAAHGAWQVRAWLSAAIRRGLMVIPPEQGWQATMIASDRVIGDHGSTTSYAAAIGRPVHLATFPDGAVYAGSVADGLTRIAPRLAHGRPLLPQLNSAPSRPRDLARALSDRPGQAAGLLRRAMYRLLDIPEPPWPPQLAAVPIARALS
jgi:hypothetical protein